MSVRPTTVLLTLAGLTLVAASGCTSSSTPTPKSSYASSAAQQQQRETQLAPDLVACLAKNGIISKQSVAGQTWYKSGQVTDNNEFVVWFHDNNGIEINLNGNSETLQSLLASAANGSWPSICGALPTTSAGS
jgi:hypothetical protein